MVILFSGSLFHCLFVLTFWHAHCGKKSHYLSSLSSNSFPREGHLHPCVPVVWQQANCQAHFQAPTSVLRSLHAIPCSRQGKLGCFSSSSDAWESGVYLHVVTSLFQIHVHHWTANVPRKSVFSSWCWSRCGAWVLGEWFGFWSVGPEPRSTGAGLGLGAVETELEPGSIMLFLEPGFVDSGPELGPTELHLDAGCCEIGLGPRSAGVWACRDQLGTWQAWTCVYRCWSA